MEIMRVPLIFFIFGVLACMPSLSYSDVKVTLTNGREIIADTCETEGSQVVCTKMGGTFDIEKKDVRSVREIKSGGNESFSEEPAASGEPQKKTDEAPGGNRTDKEKPAAVGQAEGMKRLEEITQKKRELLSERDKLVKEREQLDADLKKSPDWMSTDKYEELNKRNEQFKEKMKLFNEEAGRLNEEEKQVVEGLKKKD
jgi:predicted transcriptional regulator